MHTEEDGMDKIEKWDECTRGYVGFLLTEWSLVLAWASHFALERVVQR